MMNFDAVVVGAGHAGIEAARALAVKGFKVAFVTLDPKKIGAMSCNPAIGGVAKSHLVYEIDALGGWMGAAADENSIQSRRLNLNKGPAVRSTRVQCDKDRYAKTMGAWIHATFPNLEVIADEAADIKIVNGAVSGLLLKQYGWISCRALILTAGTFMRGMMFCGDSRQSGGRFGDKSADELSKGIVEAGHKLRRLKTGTPPRLRARSIDFSKLNVQWGDPERRRFSWRQSKSSLPQTSCYLTYTNERTHDIIRENFHRSPLFSGEIQGLGPRYCPSIEDKVKRFAERTRHQIFLEPEGLDTDSIYPNGLSTSLPENVQLDFLRSIEGLQNSELLRPGYAVEYDSIDPMDLNCGLMSRFCSGLFFAGQVNRTSGYEEAAAQGLWAGMNAGLFLDNKEFLVPNRGRSYLETLVSDLVTKGTDEPYRMFTSRSEYRLVLREDNAQERLLELGQSIGLVGIEQIRRHESLVTEAKMLRDRIGSLRKRLSADKTVSYLDYLKRPEIRWEDVATEVEIDGSDIALERLEIEAKYSGYYEKQEAELRELENTRAWLLDPAVDISRLPSLSREVVEKYQHIRPKSVFELNQISGMTPAAVLSIIKVAGRATIVSRGTV